MADTVSKLKFILSFLGIIDLIPFIHFRTQDLFGKSDPYLEFYKQTETGWQLAHRTEVNTKLLHCSCLSKRYQITELKVVTRYTDEDKMIKILPSALFF